MITRGRVIDSKIEEECMYADWTEEMLEFFAPFGPPPPVVFTVYAFEVYETLFGREIDRLEFAIIGLPDCHEIATKPNIGDELLIFLWEAASGGFGIVSNESTFRVNADGSLYSFSDAEFTARFDGLQLDVLTSEIDVALEAARDRALPWEQSE
jgi:hypothetical protein